MKPCSQALGTMAAVLVIAPAGVADISTTQTLDPAALAVALQPIGLTITSITVCNGDAVQIGTFTNFTLPPITSPDGVVMSSGSIAQIGPTADTHAPGYDPASPPWYLSTPVHAGATPEFTQYGLKTGAIQNFENVNDVACIEVTFELAQASNVKFDFVFGSVEYPFYTSQFTDSFVAFLDTTVPASQVSYDPNGAAIQVGQSFATLVSTGDLNTAFSAPHGMIKKLTTTTAVLTPGQHRLRFEVGDINDEVLDSAVFISKLRAEAGTPGTGESGSGNCDIDLNADDVVNSADIALLLSAWGSGGGPCDLNGDDVVNSLDLGMLLAGWGPCS